MSVWMVKAVKILSCGRGYSLSAVPTLVIKTVINAPSTLRVYKYDYYKTKDK